MNDMTTTSDIPTPRRTIPWRFAAWIGAGILLLLPLIFGAPWTPGDYVAGAILLFVPLGVYELAARRSRNLAFLAATGLALLSAFLMTWLTLAVGIIGHESEPANLMYFGVLLLCIAGGLISRGRSFGLSITMTAASVALIFIAIAAVVSGLGASSPIWPREVLVINGFLAALFSGSAMLYRISARPR